MNIATITDIAWEGVELPGVARVLAAVGGAL